FAAISRPDERSPRLGSADVGTADLFDSAGDVIHYTITATNDGNPTLGAVTVTDPNATGLVCTPANGSPLAPGASLSCTASHTITDRKSVVWGKDIQAYVHDRRRIGN